MSNPLSNRLAPSAKKLQMRSSESDRVSSLVQVAPSIDPETFRREVAARGGVIRSWIDQANLITIEIAARRLSELADLAGVVYVEAAQTYRP